MPEFSFEIVERGHTQAASKVLTLSDGRGIWGCVEALALRMAGREGAFIRVKNLHGETVVRAGISTALASIENCPWEDCQLKRELKHFVASGRHSVAEPDLHIDCALSRDALAA